MRWVVNLTKGNVHVGLTGDRVNHVESDAMLGPLDRQPLGSIRNAAFARPVPDQVRSRPWRRHARNVDEQAGSFLLQKVRNDYSRAPVNRLEIHPHHAVVVRLRGLDAGTGLVHDARVVDDHVQLAECLEGKRQRGFPVGFQGDVALETDGLVRLVCGGFGFGVGLVDVHDYHLGAFEDEFVHDAGTEAAATAGDDGGFSF